MHNSSSFSRYTVIPSVSITLLNFFLITTPTIVLAQGHSGHGGHGHEFQGESATTSTTGSIQVDAETAKRIKIQIEPVQRQQLDVGLKTTGQIETLPSKRVQVTAPIAGIVAQLLVEPGTKVKQGQPVAVLHSLDLVTLHVESQEKLAQGQADLHYSQADFKLAQQNYERYQQIAAAEIASAQRQVAFAQEKYEKDKQLGDTGALPRRNVLESQTLLAQAQTELTKANSRRDVIAAFNQLKRAEAAVEVAKTRIKLSNATYETRLQQLGNRGNAKGLVTVTAPIAGTVTERPVTLGQSFEDAGGLLMTIVNDSRVYATANIYEKDLNKVKIGQQVNAKVTSVPNLTFSGRIAVINSVVQGETRVVPVKAEISNPGSHLVPGMFAELEIFTNNASTSILVIKSAAVIEANGKKLIYIQNGKAYELVEVTLGETFKDMVEVKTGLFEGDLIVTQRAPQLYSQSLLGGSKAAAHQHHQETEIQSQAMIENISGMQPAWWWMIPGGIAIAVVAFLAGRRSKPNLVLIPQEIKTISTDESDKTNNHQPLIHPDFEASNHISK